MPRYLLVFVFAGSLGCSNEPIYSYEFVGTTNLITFDSSAACEAARQRALESVAAAGVTECAETLHPTCFEMTAPEYESDPVRCFPSPEWCARYRLVYASTSPGTCRRR